MPKDKCILAHYTLARQIRIVNLQSLLNVSVRKTDCADEAARERIFETQIVVELLVEMLQRDFSKEIWFGLMKYSKIVADRKAKKEKEEAEKKLKDEAEKKIKEEEAAKKKAEDEEKAAKKAEEDAAKLAEEAAKKEADAEMKTEEENAENAETAETEEKTENAKTADAEDKMDESAEVKAEESAEVKTEEKTNEEAKMDESADPVAEVKSEDKSEDAEEPAAKKSKTEEETEVKETEEEKKAKVEAAKLAAEEERKIKEREYPKYKYDHSLLMACGFFDDAYQGAIRRTDLVEILQFGGLGISNMQLTNLLRKCALGHDSISYSKMFSDIPIDFEWERPEGVVLSRNSHRNSAGVAELDSEGLRAQVDASRLATDNARGASAAYKEELERVRSKLERTESDKERQHERARTNIEKLRETVKELDSVKVEAAKVGGLQVWREKSEIQKKMKQEWKYILGVDFIILKICLMNEVSVYGFSVFMYSVLMWSRFFNVSSNFQFFTVSIRNHNSHPNCNCYVLPDFSCKWGENFKFMIIQKFQLNTKFGLS